ncbi:MAG: ATP-binding protein [Cyanobacteria bacterium]|nr:ATP-binding protein [Cyanobacteriota bacterium]
MEIPTPEEVRSIVRIPTINDDLRDFQRLFKLQQQFNSRNEIRLDFSNCRFLKQNAVAFLGGLIRQALRRGCQIRLEGSIPSNIEEHLSYNGFLEAFGLGGYNSTGSSIPYKESKTKDPSDIRGYLRDYWLGRGWITISNESRKAVLGKVWEIYDNAFEHGGSGIVVYSCGQRYQQLGVLKLSVVDFGVGIPRNVRQFLEQKRRMDWFAGSTSTSPFESDLAAQLEKTRKMRASEALRWALVAGNSTRQGHCGGLGLDEISRFVRSNGGKLEIFSETGYVSIAKERTVHQDIPYGFQGTLLNITLRMS